ncbi:vWA domain-containing protein [Mycetocola spongiae]|uniref:vWA domain-containing protein n=1 Tax=Mycetocola spongiae TaxID=2859226 RepID=UPI001CF37B22|nr:VWA domain-containing protein [Mycetocola spongiae]UCR88383.1 VWA domain-containing protein [Mycetocola spongiae]
MIFQPVLSPLLLILFFLPVIGLILWLLRGSRQRWRWIGRLGMVLLLLLILLRPGIPGGETKTLATDMDIVLVVDNTASSIAEDWGDPAQPRSVGMRSDIQAIIERYPGARFGLITFDAAAEMRVPMTTDVTALRSGLDLLTPEVTTNSRGSSISVARDLLRDTLASLRLANHPRAALVFYFGDGEQTAQNSPESFEDSASLLNGGRVFGYGTEAGGPMLQTTGRVDGGTDREYIQYQGSRALSTIDEANLRAIAEQLGVDYERRSAGSAPSLPDPADESSGYNVSGTVGTVTDLYWIPAILLAALLAAELSIATTNLVRMRRQALPQKRGEGSRE